MNTHSRAWTAGALSESLRAPTAPPTRSRSARRSAPKSCHMRKVSYYRIATLGRCSSERVAILGRCSPRLGGPPQLPRRISRRRRRSSTCQHPSPSTWHRSCRGRYRDPCSHLASTNHARLDTWQMNLRASHERALRALLRGGQAWSVCARCAHCMSAETKGYGKAMVHCVRCPTSYHRRAQSRRDLGAISARSRRDLGTISAPLSHRSCLPMVEHSLTQITISARSRRDLGLSLS